MLTEQILGRSTLLTCVRMALPRKGHPPRIWNHRQLSRSPEPSQTEAGSQYEIVANEPPRLRKCDVLLGFECIIRYETNLYSTGAKAFNRK